MTLVAMAAVEAETLGWQKQGGVPQNKRARDQHRSHLTGRARAEDPVSRHRPRSLLTRRLLRLGHRGSQVSLLLNRSTLRGTLGRSKPAAPANLSPHLLPQGLLRSHSLATRKMRDGHLGATPLLPRGTCQMILQEPLVRRRGLPPAEKQLVVAMPRHRNRGPTTPGVGPATFVGARITC